MKRETTIAHNWNYTLPSVIEYLETLMKAEAARNKSDSEIISKLNSSLFIFDNLTDDDSEGKQPSIAPIPINKPFFTFNFSLRTTMPSFSQIIPMKLNSSPIFNMFSSTYEGDGSGALGSFGSSANASPYSSDGKLNLPEATNLLLNVNESFGNIDDAFWLPANESVNLTTNYSANATSNEALSQLISTVITSTILGIMILTTVIGNVFVIAAILLERNLQQVANFLIVSLAVADLMVACLVMPLGAVYEVSNEWALGPELCDMWTLSDVLCCTASILHLVAIALDRYWAVTQIDYMHSRNGKRIGFMIFLIWVTALSVSIAPQFGLKDPDFIIRVNEQKRCLVSQDIAYQIFATMATFYVPLTAILLLYWKIFQAARKRIHKKPGGVGGRSEVKKQMLKKCTSVPSKSKFFKKKTKANGIPKEETTAFTIETSGDIVAQQTHIEMTIPQHETSSSGERSRSIQEMQFPSEQFVDHVPIIPDQFGDVNIPPPHDFSPDATALVIPSSNTMEGSYCDSDSCVNRRVLFQEVVQVESEINLGMIPQNDRLSHSSSQLCQGNMGSSQENLNVLKDESNNLVINSRKKFGVTNDHIRVSTENIRATTPEVLPNNGSVVSTVSKRDKDNHHKKTKKEILEAKREKKAAKTLAIITGAFVVCWLPFFVTVLVMTMCPECWMSDLMFSIFLWLGYFNSTLNPIIYTIFSPEFRQAFKRILCGKKHQRYRPGKFR